MQAFSERSSAGRSFLFDRGLSEHRKKTCLSLSHTLFPCTHSRFNFNGHKTSHLLPRRWKNPEFTVCNWVIPTATHNTAAANESRLTQEVYLIIDVTRKPWCYALGGLLGDTRKQADKAYLKYVEDASADARLKYPKCV